MKIFLIYHSHIDVGYTERQERIALYQADFIRQAVDCVLSERQAHRSEREKFKFTAEGFWAVEQYLKKYGEAGKQRLLQAIQTGFFELTACYFHLTELLDKDNIGRSLDYVRDFAVENGLSMPDIAMAADINGFSWGFADCLVERNVHYLSTNINVHQGGAPFGKPFRPFFWRAPSGGKILVYSGMPYHKANLLGLIPGYPQPVDAGIPGMPGSVQSGFIQGPDDLAKERVFQFVDYLQRENYPLDIVPLMGSGLYTDNSPVGDRHCELIAQWNEKYGDRVEIVTATQREFFEALCAHADQLDEYAGDWNDYWSDGVLCDPDPLRLFRNAQRGQKLIRKLDPAGEIVTAQEMDSISRNLIYFAEHTFGHSASVGAPEELLVKQLEYRKIGYAIAADSAAGELTDRLARALGEAEFTDHMPFTYRVINPHDQPIQALVHLPIDYWEQTLFDGGNFIVKDESGQEYAAQLDQGLRGEAVCCSVALQAGETKILTLYPGVSPQETVVRPQGNNSFENDFYRLQWDETGVTSLVCKSSGRELLRSGEDRLAAPVYQIFSADGRGLACGANYAARSYPANHITRGKIASIGVIKHGPVFTVLRMEYQIEGCMSYIADMTFCAALPQIAVTVKYVKELVREPEGLYVAFPLQLPDAQWYLSKTNLLFPANQLLAGVCHDYFTVEQGAALIGNGAGITLNTLDTPLIMLDDLKLWRYSDEVKGTGTLYSWLTNNKWETNFKSECSGCHESRYLLQAITPATGAPDCKSILDLRELEPLVIRSEPGSRPL